MYKCLYILGLLSSSNLKLVSDIMNLTDPLYWDRLIARPQSIQDNSRTERTRTIIHVQSGIRNDNSSF
jgi:hypothetical protein